MFELILASDKPAKRLLGLLESLGIEAYAVGGYVRDILMNRNASDLDIAVSTPPQETKRLLEQFVKVVDTGSVFGTVTAVVDGVPFELTTFRSDIGVSDGRHPNSVKLLRNINDDLARRDFTVNAIAWSKNSGLIDPFGGVNDINARLIRCVGTPSLRFREDALRILRALRFSSTLDFGIHEDTAKAIFQYAPTLSRISAERIYAELSKLICGVGACRVIDTYRDVFSVVIPGFSARRAHILKMLPHDLPLRFAALFETADAAESAMKTLKAPKAIASRVTRLQNLCPMPSDDIKIKLLGIDNETDLLMDAALLSENAGAYESIRRIRSENGFITSKNLDITAEKLLSLGVPPGKQIGQTIRALCVAIAKGKCENNCALIEEHLKTSGILNLQRQ